MIKSILVAVSLLFVTPALAATVTKTLNVNWTYPVTEEPSIVGFRVLNQDGVKVADNVAVNLRTLSVPYTYDDVNPQAFHLVAFDKNGVQTNPSNIVMVLPKYKPLVGMGKITVELIDVPK